MPRVWPARVCSAVIALSTLCAAGCVSVASTSLMPPTLVGAGPARGAVRVDLASTGLTGLDRADVAGRGSQWVSSGRIDLRAQARASRYFGARFFGLFLGASFSPIARTPPSEW